MKHVFKTSELPHIWANLTTEEIRSGREGWGASKANESFRGANYRSYAATIGKHVTNAKGDRAVILSIRRYSITTSSHQSGLRYAVADNTETFHVTTWADLEPKAVWENLCEQAKEFVTQAIKARSRAPSLLSYGEGKIAEAERARKFFGLKVKPFALDVHALADQIREQTAKAAEVAAKVEAKRAKLNAIYGPKILAGWRAHKEETPEFIALREQAQKAGLRSIEFVNWGNAALRLLKDGTRIETSKRAQVLTRTASFLWAFCAKAKATQTAVASDVLARFPRLDFYAVNSIDAHGNLTAGCHQIAFSEIEYVARLLNLPPFSEAEAVTCSPEIPAVETVEA